MPLGDDLFVENAHLLYHSEMPAGRFHELLQQLPALTRGEGVLECAFAVDRYQPVSSGSMSPTRPRTDHNPLTHNEYLLRVMRRSVTKGGAYARR